MIIKVLVLDQTTQDFRPFGIYEYEEDISIVDTLMAYPSALVYASGKDAEKTARQVMKDVQDAGGKTIIGYIKVSPIPDIIRTIQPNLLLINRNDGVELYRCYGIKKVRKVS